MQEGGALRVPGTGQRSILVGSVQGECLVPSLGVHLCTAWAVHVTGVPTAHHSSVSELGEGCETPRPPPPQGKHLRVGPGLAPQTQATASAPCQLLVHLRVTALLPPARSWTPPTPTASHHPDFGLLSSGTMVSASQLVMDRAPHSPPHPSAFIPEALGPKPRPSQQPRGPWATTTHNAQGPRLSTKQFRFI